MLALEARRPAVTGLPMAASTATVPATVVDVRVTAGEFVTFTGKADAISPVGLARGSTLRRSKSKMRRNEMRRSVRLMRLPPQFVDAKSAGRVMLGCTGTSVSAVVAALAIFHAPSTPRSAPVRSTRQPISST